MILGSVILTLMTFFVFVMSFILIFSKTMRTNMNLTILVASSYAVYFTVGIYAFDWFS